MAQASPLPSPTKPKSPRSRSSKQLTRPDSSRIAASSVPSSPNLAHQPLRSLNETPLRTPNTGPRGIMAEPTSTEQTSDNDDVEDPHDLSFSSNHILRASMVDNLVMSLDQFSSSTFDDVPYTPRNNSHDTGARVRKRGHTFSSSLSSEADLQDMRVTSPVPETVPRMPVRNSTRHQKNLQRLPSIFGEDEESARAKVYNAQRGAQPGHGRRTKNASGGGKSIGSSASSSIDLGHLASFSGRLGGPGDRRSRSFDFGSRQRNPRTSQQSITPADGAPTPVIFAGPEAQNSTQEAPFSTPLVRKNSTKSSKSAYVKKGRAGVLGTNAMRLNNDSVPQLPSMKSVPSLSHAALEQKANAGLGHDTIAFPRPGFFRRVFGSSRYATASMENNSHTPNSQSKQHHGRSTPVQEEMPHPSTPAGRLSKPARQASTDASANKENQQVVTKKSSVFFRRRKKSISSSVPPPLPLTLASELKADPDPDSEPASGTSPVSSLRAFMNPYLADNPAPSHGHTRTGSLQGFLSRNGPPPAFGLSKEPKARGHSRKESYGSNRTLKTNPNQAAVLRIPHHDSFLADSSSTEESSRRAPLDGGQHSDSEKATLRHRQSVNDSRLGLPTPSSTLSSPTPDPKKATTPPSSWRSEQVSPLSSMIINPVPGTVGTDSKSNAANRTQELEVSRTDSKSSPFASTSDVSEYRSAPTTPFVAETPTEERSGLAANLVLPHSQSRTLLQDAARVKAQQIFDNTDEEIDSQSAGAWLGEAGPEREHARKAYMELFDWSDRSVIDSLRGLCDRIILRGETQQMDRIMDSFAQRWCECNLTHLYKSSDVVHTICYSILLLNTDLHLADIGQKMTKAQFVRNTLPTIKRVAQGPEPDNTVRGSSAGPRTGSLAPEDPNTTLRGPKRSVDRSSHDDQSNSEAVIPESVASSGPGRAWEMQIESVLRLVYNSIAQEPLPLFGAQPVGIGQLNQSNNFLSVGSNMLRRTPSVLSKAHSDTNRSRYGVSKSLGARFLTKGRSRPRLPSAAGFGSSRTSIDEQSSTWSPSMSSTWSKVSLGKTLTSMSVDSFATEATHADYQSSIGFANALSQAIIREDQLDLLPEEGLKAGSLLEDESLELCGAPWAKEGIVRHKCHLEGVDKRSKDRNWNDCFAVIEKGWMRLFSFSLTAKSLRNKARAPKAGAIVGGGNWQENAEEVWKFMLRHTIASSLPPPGYSKARPYVWALSLPTGAVHLFSVGTPDIVKEFVSTANFWSARLSKEPMMGGISNMEYGWSDAVVSRAPPPAEPQPSTSGAMSPRPSTQMSMRSSMEHAGGMRAKLAGDRVHINEWAPPQQSMFASQWMEVDQLKALQTYVSNVEDELQKHNELRGPMLLAFSSKHPDSTKAMQNWEKKSSYLLREIVKFRTYIDTLQTAQTTKERIYRMRREEDEAQRTEIDSRVLSAHSGVGKLEA